MAEVRRKIPAPRDVVWDALADPTTYPEWLVGAQRIRDVEPGFPKPGADFHHSVGVEPFVVPDRTTAVEAKPKERLVLEARARPFIRARVTFELRSDGEEKTDVRLEEHPIGPWGVLGPVLGPLIRARNTRSLEALEAYLTWRGRERRG